VRFFGSIMDDSRKCYTFFMRNPKTQSFEGENSLEQEEKRNELHFENVEITPDRPYEFPLRLVKRPIEVNDGDELGDNGARIKFEGKLARLMEESAKLKDLPEQEKIGALLDLVRSNLRYPYPEVIEAAKKENPELGEWLDYNFGKNPRISIDTNECLSHGYGDCKIMAAAYLAAGKTAGLKGIIGGGFVKNLERPDTKSPIFKSSELKRDEDVSHSWIEVQSSTGAWIPMDVSANMIASTPEMLEFFKKANYRRQFYVLMNGLPKGLQGNVVDAYFEPGQGEGSFMARIEIETAGPLLQKKPVMDKFQGDLCLSISADTERKRIEFDVIKEES